MPILQLKGSLPALLTPLTREDKVDKEAFQNFVQWQIDQGSHGVCPVGTTGESHTLDHDEHKLVIELCLEVARGRVPVVAGTGSNATHEAIDMTQHAQELGVDAVLIVTPYYNRPTQEGMFQHFKAVHDNSDIPIVLYNVPGRSVVNLSVDTVARLSELPRVIGIKDATADLSIPVPTRGRASEGFTLLSGEDATVVPFLSLGGHGCVSVTANIAPRLCADLHEAWWKRDLDKVTAINDRLMPLHNALFLETSPQPAKFAASVLGLMDNNLRLPMIPVQPETEKAVIDAMSFAGLIEG